MDITSKLETIKHRWEEMGEQLADPAVASDMKKFQGLQDAESQRGRSARNSRHRKG